MAFAIAYRAGSVISVKLLAPLILGATAVKTSANVSTMQNAESLMDSACVSLVSWDISVRKSAQKGSTGKTA